MLCQSAGRVACMRSCNFLSPLEASGFITSKPCVYCGYRSASEVTETEVHFATATSGSPDGFGIQGGVYHVHCGPQFFEQLISREAMKSAQNCSSLGHCLRGAKGI